MAPRSEAASRPVGPTSPATCSADRLRVGAGLTPVRPRDRRRRASAVASVGTWWEQEGVPLHEPSRARWPSKDHPSAARGPEHGRGSRGPTAILLLHVLRPHLLGRPIPARRPAHPPPIRTPASSRGLGPPPSGPHISYRKAPQQRRGSSSRSKWWPTTYHPFTATTRSRCCGTDRKGVSCDRNPTSEGRQS